MSRTEITWIGGNRYVASDSTMHSVVVSPPGDIGMKPPELLLVSLGTCAAFDVVKIVEKQRVTLDKLSLEISGEQASEAPWAYTSIHLHFKATAANLGQNQLEKAIDLSMNRYCSVRATLSPEVKVTFDAEIQSPGAPEA